MILEEMRLSIVDEPVGHRGGGKVVAEDLTLRAVNGLFEVTHRACVPSAAVRGDQASPDKERSVSHRAPT